MAQDLFSRLAQQTLAELSPASQAPQEAGDDPVSAILQVAQERGIDPAHLLGLAKLETQAGRKTVKGDGADTRNLFNVKDFSKDGAGIRARDNAEGSNDRYRQYGSYRESVEDLAGLLERRYPGAVKAGSPEEFARELKRGGYATDPAYERKLASTIRSGGAARSPDRPQEWDQGARYAPVGLAAQATDQSKPATKGESEGLVGSMGNAIWQGAKSLGRSVMASGNTAVGDLTDVELLAAAQKRDAQNDPQAMQALKSEIEVRKKANPDAKWWQAIGDVGDAAWQNKLGTAQLIANQAPNSAVALGGGWAGGLAGAKLGALAAPFTGGLSVPVGATVGALAGMFLGNYAMESGGKALEKAEGGFTQDEANASMTEGAKKAAVVTGVDALTLGAGKLVGRTVFGAPVRAGARAEAQVLADAGVDITNKAAIAQALATNQALKQTAIEAGKQAAKGASKVGTRVAQAGTGLTMETLGEGAGEYFGEELATGKGDIYDAALEALSSATQSVPQTAMAMRSSSGNELDPSGIVRAAKQSGGIASRAGLAATPGAQQPSPAAPNPAATQPTAAAALGAAGQSAAGTAAGSAAAAAPTGNAAAAASPAQPAQTPIQASAMSAIEQALEADKQRRRAAGEVVEDEVEESDVVAAGDPAAVDPPEVFTPPAMQVQPTQPAQPASAGFSLPVFDSSPIPKMDPAAADEQRRQFAEFEQKRKNRRAGTRASAWERNPFMAFLGANGLNRDTAGEFAPGLTERRKAFVPGYGPVFRAGAKNLDELVQTAKEDGFLSDDQDENDLYDLIDRALRGERIAPLYADGAAEAEGERRLREMQERESATFDDYLAQQEADPLDLTGEPDYDERDLAEIGSADVTVQNEVAALQQQYADLGFDPADVLESLATQTENLPDQAYYDLAKSRFIQLLDQAYGQAEPQAEQGGDRAVRLDTGPQSDAQADGGAAGSQAAPVTPPAAPIAASLKRADAIRAKLDGLKSQGFSQFTKSGGRTLLLNPDTYETVELTPAEMAVAKAASGQARAGLQSLLGQRKPVQVSQQGADVLQSYTPADVLAQDEQAQSAQAQQVAEQQAAAAKAKADDERRRIEQASYAAADSFELGQNPLDSLTGQKDIFGAAPADVGLTAKDMRETQAYWDGLHQRADKLDDPAVKDAQSKFESGEIEAPEFDAAIAAAEQRSTRVAQDLAGERINAEWTAFDPQSGTLGIPRAEMPQIKAEHRGAMVNFLKARGIDGQQETIPATAIKPTQAEFSPEKVKKAIDYTGGNRSIIVSADGYVVDGHHQWLAAREKGEPIQAIRLDQNIGDVLAALKDMPSAQPEQAKKPEFTLDPLDWSPGKLADAYDMAQLNQLYAEVREQFSNPVVGEGPVDKVTGLATKERLDAQGRKMFDALQKAIDKAYKQKKAQQSAGTSPAPEAPSNQDDEPAQATLPSGAGQQSDEPVASRPFATAIEKTKTGWKILGDPDALAEHARDIFGKGVVKRKDGISLATKNPDVAGNFPVRFDEYRLADLPERHGRIEVRVNQDGSASVRSLDGGHMGPLLPSAAEAIADHRKTFGDGESVSAASEQSNAAGPAESSTKMPDASTGDGESPNAFIPAPNGSLDYGEITSEMSQAMRRQAGKIRLQRGNAAFGLRHIEERHGDEIRNSGFKSIEEFIAAAVSGIESVWKPAATSQLVVIQSTEQGRVVFIQLQAGKDESGDFYTVNTAFPSSRSYAEKRKEWKKLWSRVPVPAADTGTSASSAELGNKAGSKPAMESSQSLDGSVARPAQGAQAVWQSDPTLEAIFDQLDGITQRTQASGQQAAAAHPQAERIQLVQKHILDILEDLEDSGKVTINC